MERMFWGVLTQTTLRLGRWIEATCKLFKCGQRKALVQSTRPIVKHRVRQSGMKCHVGLTGCGPRWPHGMSGRGPREMTRRGLSLFAAQVASSRLGGLCTVRDY